MLVHSSNLSQDTGVLMDSAMLDCQRPYTWKREANTGLNSHISYLSVSNLYQRHNRCELMPVSVVDLNCYARTVTFMFPSVLTIYSQDETHPSMKTRCFHLELVHNKVPDIATIPKKQLSQNRKPSRPIGWVTHDSKLLSNGGEGVGGGGGGH